MQTMALSTEIADFRAFNRLYTRRIGLLNRHLDDSPFSLSEARILFELANRDMPTAADLVRELGIDPGQLSRTLRRFVDKGFVQRVASPTHGKHQQLALTDSGRRAFADLERGTIAGISALLGSMAESDRQRLHTGMRMIGDILSDRSGAPYSLRSPQIGDLGMITARQAILYAQEFGWDWTYEALVAKIFAEFVASFDSAREAGWIAERDGSIVGSVFLMRHESPDVGKLRLLYVEPSARGLGVGRALVDACVERARAIGFARLQLWTNSVLVSARRIYQATGFRLIEETPHHSFGKNLVGQTWSLDLT